MPGKRGKKRSQDKDVSFHFHSGGSSEKGAYLSSRRNDNPVFSDEFDEDESSVEAPVIETTSNTVSTREKDQEAIQELLESAIEDATTDKRYSKHPLESTNSNDLFELEYEPQTRDEDGQRETPVETTCAKYLEYKQDVIKHEQPPDTEKFSDSDDFFNTDERDNTLRFNDNNRLLDSDDEELFYSFNKPLTSNNMSDENEIDYGEEKTSELEDLPTAEEENLPTIQGHDSSVMPSVQVNDFEEDSKALSEVDTHPLIFTETFEDEVKEQTKDDPSHDTCNQELPMSEEYFTKVADDQQPKVPPRRNVNRSVSKGKAPPPRPPPPNARKGPGIAIRSRDEMTASKSSTVPSSNNNHTGVKHSALPISPKKVNVTKETREAVLTLPTEEDENAKPSGQLDGKEICKKVHEDSSLSLRYFVVSVIIVFLYYSLNFSSYLAGFMTGFLFFFVTTAGSFIMYVKHLQTWQQQEKEAIKKSMETSSQEFISRLGVDFEELSFLKNNKFGVRCEYDLNTHRSSDVTPANIKLEDSVLTLSVKIPNTDEPPGRFWHFWTQEKVSDCTFMEANAIVKQFNMSKCSVMLVPDDTAQNRKRRWSRKYPICLQFNRQIHHKRQHVIYLFSPTAKDKEFWYRYIKLFSEGYTRQKIIEEQERFYSYMFHYMPQSINEGTIRKSRKERRKKSSLCDSSVHFSMKTVDEGDEEDEETNTTVSITKRTNTAAASSKVGVAGSTTTKSASAIPPTVPDNMDWLNTALARLCWDIWNEDHWLKWITSKIQRRMSRIKTPSFMEPLSVSEVNLGTDIPVVRRIYAPPSLDYKGVWIYLLVKYKGTFNMTLETKMKLGRNSKNESEPHQLSKPYVISGHTSSDVKSTSRRNTSQSSHSNRNTSQSSYSNSLTVQNDGLDADDTDASNTPSSLENSTEEPPPNSRHQSSPRSIPSLSSALSQNSTKLVGGSPDSEIDSGSDDDDTSSSLSTSPNIQATASIAASTNTAPHKPGRWMSMFDRIKNSSIVQRAANTRLVRMAADKVSSYNLYLTVEVKSLEGYLVVNMSPPPSDIIWYGFQGKPILDLSAKPKLGHREVTIHYVTEWIENKLKEVVEKQLVFPNMESIAIPVLKSAIPEDSVKLLTSPK